MPTRIAHRIRKPIIMRASIQVDNPVRMSVLINHVDGALVLENLKRRSHIRSARDSWLKAPGLRICSPSICENPLLLDGGLGPIRDLAVWWIDNHVRALQARVCIGLSHPDATEIGSGVLGPRGAASGGERHSQSKSVANVSGSRRRENESRHALPRYSHTQSARCLWADGAAKLAGSRAGNTPWDPPHAPRRGSC